MSRRLADSAGHSRHPDQRGNIMSRLLMLPLFAVLIALQACVTVPTSPSVMALPGTGKSFEQFRNDDAVCRQYAYEQAGGMAGQQAAQGSAVTSAVAGTALGTAAGALIGAGAGDAGAGAAIGAGTGLLLGSAAGSGAASESSYDAQRRYDNAYLQCMYAKGNQIPGYYRGGYREAPRPRSSTPPPPPDYPPPGN